MPIVLHEYPPRFWSGAAKAGDGLSPTAKKHELAVLGDQFRAVSPKLLRAFKVEKFVFILQLQSLMLDKAVDSFGNFLVIGKV